jgi:hypothetical protein
VALVPTSPAPIACESRIERVVVYARGAVVTRRVTVPDALPDEPVELLVAGVTALAEAGSVRAVAGGEREVTALKARVVVPDAPAPPGALLSRVRSLALENERLEAERASLAERRAGLAGAALDPAMRRWARNVDPAARFADALAVSALLGEETARVDALIRAVAAALADNRRAREAADLAAAQGRPEDLAGRAAPRLDVLVRLGAGGGAVGSLALEYVVRGARWWPAYTARFTAAATRVALAVDAFVAQATGEDWGGIKLSLSTADLAEDARLPELRSLRFGRAQPAPKRGYRAPPDGLDAMFEGYDRAAPKPSAAPPDLHAAPAYAPGLPLGAITIASRTEASETPAEKRIDLKARLGKATMDAAPPPPGSAPKGMAMPARAAPVFAPPAPAKSGGLLGMLSAPSLAPMTTRGGGWDGLLDEEGGGGGRSEPEPPAPIEPADAWLDFDTLIVRDGTDRAHRGRLARDPGVTARGGASVEALSGPPLTSDPAAGRGRFDHRYDAEGTSDVPASGRPHRVAVTSAEAPAVPRFVAVPRDVAEVFREVEVQNPLAAPLLAGPVDVFLDGALMTTSQMAFVDRSGFFRLGLGVEDRLRIARNARVEESTAGLLGGSAVVTHAITVDLASSLGHKVTVDVLERVPVSDEKDIEIKLTHAKPEPREHTQADRGAPIRQGLCFTVEVPAGDKARIELGYRVTLPSKNEIVGGNRRE